MNTGKLAARCTPRSPATLCANVQLQFISDFKVTAAQMAPKHRDPWQMVMQCTLCTEVLVVRVVCGQTRWQIHESMENGEPHKQHGCGSGIAPGKKTNQNIDDEASACKIITLFWHIFRVKTKNWELLINELHVLQVSKFKYLCSDCTFSFVLTLLLGLVYRKEKLVQ